MRILRFGFVILLMAGISAAQESPSISSFRQARQVLDAALQAHGGAAIKDLQSISAKFDGELIHRNQSHRPEAPYERTPITGTLGVDLKSNETYFDQTGSWVGGFNWSNRTVRTKDGGVSYDRRNRVANAFPPNNPQVAPNFT